MTDPVRIALGVAPDSSDSDTFRHALAPFAGRVALTFGAHLLGEGKLGDAEVLVQQRLGDDELAAAPRLRWFASWAAGLDSVARPSVLARGLVLTNASGVHGPNVAEQAIAMMLMFTRGLPVSFRAQLARRWERPATTARGLDELTGKTLAIIGLGRIGDALAERARPFGMRVVGVKRDPSFRHDAAVAVDEVHGFDQLDSVLARADHVVVLVPLTPDTRHLFDARRLSHLRPEAYMYNFARGAVIDERALIRALTDRTLAGAGLDVFEEEPLPSTSPLWDLENVILTPHTGGLTPHYFTRFADILAANVARFLAGTPLKNTFATGRGY